MRLAIVGAGISGLVVAHLLHRDHEITMFEANDYPGGHTNTIAVASGERTYQVDTGFIVFNDRNYPSFERLLTHLGVPCQRSEMSFGVSDIHGEFEYSGASANGLFATRRHIVTPRFHRMVADLLRFNRAARELLEGGDGVSLGDWLQQLALSDAFVERLIVPQASAVWSADPQQLWSIPARFLLEFFDNHGMLGFSGRPRWSTVSGGAARYVEALIKPWRARLQLSTPIESLRRAEDHVLLTARGRSPERFDEVVIATHSDQALALLADPSTAEREILGAIPYLANEAVLHTDVRMLPRRQRAWASWNYHLLDRPLNRPTVTYHMNRLQSLRCAEQLCVTLNRSEEIDPEKVKKTISYAHPVYTAEGMRAQRRWTQISGVRRTHYCGAYWGWGFHEDGVVSGLRVAQAFGASL
ncbi:MAG TPA: FAD-dependent oxidoreductase [Solirubrobacteraceae bacterium]|jgi:predicted NAD/FAD-binding protein